MKKFIGLSLLVFILSISSSSAHAASATLSLSNTGDGDSVRVRVSGSPSSDTELHFMIGNNYAQPLDLGKTDDAGFLSTVISPGVYGITPAQPAYVVVGGTRSSSVTWPNLPGTVTGTDFSLQVDTITLMQGSSTVVPINNLGSGTVSVLNNSNSSVAQVVVNGTQLFVTAKENGSATATICLAGGTSHCQTLSITVGSGSTQSFTLSNPSPAVIVGQNLMVPINGAVSGTFYISSNSNPSVAQANVSSTVVTITGTRVGTSNMTLCKSSGGCISFVATVIGTGGGGTHAAPALSPSSVSISVGQTQTVLVAGNGGYFISNNNNPDVASATISGSGIVVKGLIAGSRIVSLCDSNNQCSTLSIKVSAFVPPVPVTPTPPTQSPSGTYQFTTNLSRGDEGLAVTALQGVLKVLGFLTVAPNGYFGPSTQAAVMAFQAAHKIPTLGSVGPQTRAALNGLTGASGGSTTPSSGTSGSTYVFTTFLGVGSTGTAVTELQNRLASLGFFSGSATGYFGPLTAAAVAKFQAAHAITQAGYVGPSTRAALNGS